MRGLYIYIEDSKHQLLTRTLSSIFDYELPVDHIVDGIFYTIAFILAPSVFGADINTLILSLLVISVNFTFMICFMSAENLKVRDQYLTSSQYHLLSNSLLTKNHPVFRYTVFSF
jgi:metal-sulfur cluster biosynthetic enzyme